MPESGTAGQPIVDAGTQVGTPVATMGFGARETADETRQAQHTEANDAPDDLSMQRVEVRSQALTVDVLGKAFVANSDRRDKTFDLLSQVLFSEFAKKPGAA